MNTDSDAPLVFVRSLLTNPKQVGAVAPSSPALSRLMTSTVEGSKGPVLEVGAGTGAITRELIQRGVHTDRLVLVERDPTMAAFLRRKFPRVRVLCGDALHSKRLLAAADMGPAGTIISSLPLRNFSRPEQIETLRGMVAALAGDGQLIQFTYAAGCPVPWRHLGLRAERLGRVWLNMPPAAVWRFTVGL